MCVKLTAAGVISCRGEIDVCEKLTAVGAISCGGDLFLWSHVDEITVKNLGGLRVREIFYFVFLFL